MVKQNLNFYVKHSAERELYLKCSRRAYNDCNFEWLKISDYLHNAKLTAIALRQKQNY